MKIAASWKSNHLYFKRDEIETLKDDQCFKIETPDGDFIIKKADFDRDFEKPRKSNSYKKGQYSITLYNVSPKYIKKYFHPKKKISNKLLVLRVGYMEEYEGLGEISSGGAHIDSNGEGAEMWNFRAEDGYCYGYAMSVGFSGIDLNKLFNTDKYSEGDEASGIDIIFISKKPNVGQVVIGWYKDATVFHKQYRTRRNIVKNENGWNKLYYLCEVACENAHLLEEKERKFIIPHGQGFPGRSNVWYPHDEGDAGKLFTYIHSWMYQDKKEIKFKKTRIRWRPDHDIISQIEKSAITKTVSHYVEKGFEVSSVEKDNRGWDLEAKDKNGNILLIEVKGHMGNVVQFELTPNEYDQLKKNLNNYRVCVVFKALINPELCIFRVAVSENRYYLISEQDNRKVEFVEKIAAKGFEVEVS